MVVGLMAGTFPPLAQGAPALTIRYVATDGVDSGGCASTAAVCRTLQYAVNQASTYDHIFVAGGTYTYNATPGVDTCTFLITRAIVCIVNKTLRLVGGFSRSNWAVPQPDQNITIIDGQNTRRGVSLTSYNGVARLLMENFTIQNGRATGATSGTESDYRTYAAGGGIDSTTGSVDLVNVVLRNNLALGGHIAAGYGGGGIGGGLAIRSSPVGATSTLNNVTFENNIAQGGGGPDRGGVAQGGGLFVDHATVTGNNLLFISNKAYAANSTGSGTSNGLQADALGGAVAFGDTGLGTLSNITIRASECIGGNATGSGGFCFGGGFYAENKAVVTINNALIEQNSARGGTGTTPGGAFGGGVATFDANATINQSRIINNTAQGAASTNNSLKAGSGGGGAMFIGWNGAHQVNLTNSVVADNGISLSGSGADPGMGGAGLSFQGINGSIVHSTIANNTFDSANTSVGQAIYALSAGTGRTSAVTLEYSIVANHTNSNNAAAIHVNPNNAITLNRGLFANNTRNTNSDGVPGPAGSYTGLASMLSAPSANFVSATNYRLTDTSPAVDSANGSTTPVDMIGRARPYGAQPDIGAYEYVPVTTFVFLPFVRR
jgi:hypothetical protein